VICPFVAPSFRRGPSIAGGGERGRTEVRAQDPCGSSAMAETFTVL
jgi:hypothetical protein